MCESIITLHALRNLCCALPLPPSLPPSRASHIDKRAIPGKRAIVWRRLSSCILVACGILVLVVFGTERPRSGTHPSGHPPSDDQSSLAGIWLLGERIHTPLDNDPQIQSQIAPKHYDDASVTRKGVRLHVTNSGTPLHIVPRTPRFVGLIRTDGMPPAPNGSLHFERPLPGVPAEAGTACVSTRDTSHRLHRLREWTLELVVNFLENPHFGHEWQTVVGVNGYNITASGNDDDRLSALAVKLSPQRNFLLQAWVERRPSKRSPRQKRVSLVSRGSTHFAEPNRWYHIALVSDGRTLQLSVNSHLEASVRFNGTLVSPRRHNDGDLTFGCGMHAGVPADTCSCLLTEARVSDRALPSMQWLWSRPQRARNTKRDTSLLQR